MSGVVSAEDVRAEARRRVRYLFFSVDVPCEQLLGEYQHAYQLRCNELEAAEARIAELEEALEAMMPGRLGSELAYMTNPLYHACVHIARAALEKR